MRRVPASSGGPKTDGLRIGSAPPFMANQMEHYTQLMTNTPDAESRQPRISPFERTALLAAIAGYWLVLINILRVDWGINPQYSYGWLVPAIAAGLFWRRWQTRPKPATSGGVFWLRLWLGLCLAIMLPMRSVEEANPEWRFLFWMHGLLLVSLTGACVYRLGGWPWTRHFAFPIFFSLVMVPWPMALENFTIQGLMQQVAGWTVDLAGLLRIPALQHGNVIEISSGLVGIDEACSGVRSLQTSIMVSLFLGEYYRMRPARRVFLALASVILVVLANLGRTTSLVSIASHQGMESMRGWHDRIGDMAMWAALIGLWALALQVRGKSAPAPPSQSNGIPGRRFSTALLLAVICWAVFC